MGHFCGYEQLHFLVPGCILFRVFWLQINRKLLQITLGKNRKFIPVYQAITEKLTQKNSWAGTRNWETDRIWAASFSPHLPLSLCLSPSFWMLIALPTSVIKWSHVSTCTFIYMAISFHLHDRFHLLCEPWTSHVLGVTERQTSCLSIPISNV